MENMEKNCAGGVCSCGGAMGCCGYHSGKHHLVKVILKIFIVIIIFWCGYRLGMMTGYLRAGYGGQYGQENFGGWGMMRGYNNYYNNLPSPTPTK